MNIYYQKQLWSLIGMVFFVLGSVQAQVSAPANLTASNATGTTVDLDWDDVSGAVEYEVYNSANFATVTTAMSDVTLVGLPEATIFNVGVRALDGDGNASQWVFLNGVATVGCVPDEPTGLSSSNPGATTIDLDWEDVEGAVSYEVYNSANFAIASTMTSDITLMGLPEATYFNVGVRAKCMDGGVSNWVFLDGLLTVGCVPDKPENLESDNPTSTTIDLNWDDVDGAVEYEVYNSANLAIVATANSEITLTGLPEGTFFNVGIRAVCADGDVSEWSFLKKLSTCRPGKPKNVIVFNATSSTIDVDWDDVIGASKYEVYNSFNFDIVTVTESEVTLTGFPEGVAFNVGVRAFCSNGDVSQWVFVNNVGTCVPNNPTNLSASNPTTSTLDIDWDDVGGASEYEIYNSATFATVTATESEVTLTGLPEATTFNVSVRAKCVDGDVSAWVFLNGVSTIGCVPDKPTNLSASNPTTSTLDIDWDDVPFAVEYEVYNSATLTTVTTAESAVTLMGLPENTTFNVSVRAVCADGDVSNWAFLNGVSTIGCEPDNPMNLSASNATNSTVDIDWDDVPFAAEYEVYNSANFATVTTTISEVTLMGLPAGTTFNVGVRAVCTNGDVSAWVFLNGVSTSSNRPWVAKNQNDGSVGERETDLSQQSPVLASDVTVFPNPVMGGEVNIVLKRDEQTIQRITLFNSTGQMVQRIEGIDQPQYVLPLTEQMNAGTYILRIEGADFAITKRLMIQ
jgi:chitodextrinase